MIKAYFIAKILFNLLIRLLTLPQLYHRLRVLDLYVGHLGLA